MFDLNKKEKPFTSFGGFGGGGLGLAGGAISAKTYVDDVFSTDLWTGNDTARNITSGLDMTGEGGMVWIKRRNGATNPMIWDTERGTYHLETDGTGGQSQFSNFFTGFTGTGYSIGTNGNINGTSSDVVGWSFRKAPGFFDVVTYTGNQTARTISHSLDSVPGMIIIKCTSDGSYWRVYHRSTGATKALELNSTEIANNETYWNSTSPTSSVFSLSAETAINKTGETYVAYIFAHDSQVFGTDEDESIIKCGSYAGNGTSGQIINLGFEAQWLMIKSHTRGGAGYGWTMVDIMRDRTLFADETGNSGGGFLSATPSVSASANGFHLLNGDSNFNESGESYVYMAIRRPNKPPEAAINVFAVDYGNGSSTIPAFDSTFPVDFAIAKVYGSIDSPETITRLTGTKALKTDTTAAEVNNGANWVTDSNAGWGKVDYTSTRISWMFKRAPGFMDVVAYIGDGTASHAVPHNLEAVPELLIVKHRNGGTRDWHVYTQTTGNQSDMRLNQNNPATTGFTYWANTTPTATHFYVSNVPAGDIVNQNNNPFLALLFATLPGISKVGSYSGTGNNINVDCGFTGGARFVLIKRTDNNGNWVLFDSLRGIVNGNDPYIKLNTTEAQKTDENHIAPLNAGFTVSSSSEGDTNANGGSYIFLAIA